MFSSSEQFEHVTTVCSGWSSVAGIVTSFNITGSNTIVSRISLSLDFAVAPGTRKVRTASMLAIRLFIVKKKGPCGPVFVTDSGSGQSALEGNDVVGVYTRFTYTVESLDAPRVERMGIEPMSNVDAQFNDLGVKALDRS